MGGLMTEVVAALIWQDDKFLICQRPSNKTRALLWEFPGGKLEARESMKEALNRECQEELGITLKVLDKFHETCHGYDDIYIRLTIFNAVISEGVPEKKEHNDIRWIRPEEIPDYEFCPADEEFLVKLMEGGNAID